MRLMQSTKTGRVAVGGREVPASALGVNLRLSGSVRHHNEGDFWIWRERLLETGKEAPTGCICDKCRTPPPPAFKQHPSYSSRRFSKRESTL